MHFREKLLSAGLTCAVLWRRHLAILSVIKRSCRRQTLGAGLTDKDLSPEFGGASSLSLPSLTEGVTALRVLSKNAPLMLREIGEKTSSDPLQNLKKYMPHLFSLYLPAVASADNINGPLSFVMEEPVKVYSYDWAALIPLLKNLYQDSKEVCEAPNMTARVAAHEVEWKALGRSKINADGVDYLRQPCEAFYMREAPRNEFYIGQSRTFSPSLVGGG